MTTCTDSGHRASRVWSLFVLSIATMVPRAWAQPTHIHMERAESGIAAGTVPGAASERSDLGALPESQMLTFEVRLKPSTERAAALDELIASQMDPGSASYRKWVTAAEFGTMFGATEDQISAVSGWLESEGLTVPRVSTAKTRIEVSGSVGRVQSAFGVRLRRYGPAEAEYFALGDSVSLPEGVAGLVRGVSGLGNYPLPPRATVRALGTYGAAIEAGGASSADAFAAIEDAVDRNTQSILLLETPACGADVKAMDREAYRAVLRQAEAQGITVLATTGCSMGASGTAGSFPADLAEVTAIALPGGLDVRGAGTEHSAAGFAAASFAGMAARPAWQSADGLPADGFRAAPDLSVESVALAQTLAKIEQETGTRLGNVAPTLYELAKTPKLFTQVDGAVAGTWERATGLGVVDLKLLEKVFPRGSVGTSSLLVAADYAPMHGHTLTLTATVTSTGGTGIPTGAVTFTSAQKGTLGTATLDSTGVATFSSSTLPGGTYTLTSVYSGDATYAGSISGIATVTVIGEVSVISATVEAGAVVGGSATIDVSVTSGSGVGTPSGTVTAAPQGTTNADSASVTISGSNGTATGKVLLPVYQAGQFTVLISCTDPDPSFTCYSPLSVEMVVGKGASSTTVTASPDEPAAGASYTLTATVAASPVASARRGTKVLFARTGAPRAAQSLRLVDNKQLHGRDTSVAAPTGSVQFLDGGTVLGTQAIDSGVATYTGTANASTHSFSAVYSGDQNYDGSNSSAPVTTAGGLPTTTSLTAASYVVLVGQTVTLYSTVFSTGVPSTMTGTVTYTAATQGVLGTATVVAGLATLTLNALSAGVYNLSATYSGDATFAPSTSTTTVIVTVTAANAVLSGAITPNPVTYGSDATLAATASFPSGVTGGPMGMLQAAISGVAGGTYTQPLVASATGPSSKATFVFPAPVVGKYSVSVSCPASDVFACGAPATVPLTVVQGVTQTVLTLNPAAPFAGQKTLLTATVSNTGNDPSSYTFTGTVQFFVNGSQVGAGAISGGPASLSVALPANPATSVSAVYSGDTNWKGSTSTPVLLAVTALPSSTILTSNVSNAITGVQVVLTATVTGASTAFVPASAPSGLVDFFDTSGGTVSKLGSSTLAGLGANTSVATFNATSVQGGAHAVYAVYEGDQVYGGSTSPTVTLGFTNFSVTFVPATMTLTRGQIGQATLIVNFVTGFTGTVSFGCVPPPNVELTCSFAPSVLAQGGTTTLNVDTVAPSSAKAGGHAGLTGGGVLSRRLAGGAAMALLFLCIRPRRFGAPRVGLLLLLVAIAAGGVTGCSGTHLAGTTPPADPAAPTDPGSSLGTQILTITAAGSDGTNTVRHDFQFQVTVQ